MDVVDRHLMDCGFGFTEALKHGPDAQTLSGRQVRCIDQPEDLMQAPMPLAIAMIVRVLPGGPSLGGFGRVLDGFSGVLTRSCRVRRGSCNVRSRPVRVLVHGELRGREAGTEDTLGMHVDLSEREAAQRSFQILERQTGVDQRAERHIARNPGETIEVQHPAHNWRDSLKL
jgi:hypothetical protein